MAARDNPTRDGFTFKGWDPVVPATMPSDNQICTAQWEKVVDPHTITFETAGGTPIDPITEDEGTLLTQPEDPKKEHYVFKGWMPEFPSEMPSKDLVLTATWEPVDISAQVKGLVSGEEIASYQWYYSKDGTSFKKSGAKTTRDGTVLSLPSLSARRRARPPWPGPSA